MAELSLSSMGGMGATEDLYHLGLALAFLFVEHHAKNQGFLLSEAPDAISRVQLQMKGSSSYVHLK